MAFAQAHSDFQTVECDLLGLPINSWFSLLAWVRSMKEMLGVTIPSPVIDDLSMRVANTYGMAAPGSSGTSTVRGVFVTDREGGQRAMASYAKDDGRSIARSCAGT